ncbi:hypothetical protein [Flavobacterium enshiense]|uniref:Lipoprotein n=1 Tax=Flavobacterium enshiense DK69 TaxID=1107311 RepID=A0A0A2MVL2_9FLAO|nr:hypothetical protein [Flavobacterium enshiense]KGO95631.1 hypothetical protein Q767_10420 [Flavobacterium enshiense DK69]
MKSRILLALSVVLVSCASKKEKITKATAQIQIDERISLFRNAYNMAVEDKEADSIYRNMVNDYYFESRKKYSNLRNHPLIDFIRGGKYWGVDLPSIALCFENETYEIRKNVDFEDLNDNFKWYAARMDTLSVLLADFHQKSKNTVVKLEEINFEKFNNELLLNKVDEKFNDFFRTTVKAKVNIYFDPLNSYVNKAITFVDDGPKITNFLIGYYSKDINDTPKHFDVQWDENYRRAVFQGITSSFTAKLFRKYYDKELKTALLRPKYLDVDLEAEINSGIAAKLISVYYPKEVGEKEYERLSPNTKIVFDMMGKYVDDKEMSIKTIYKEIMIEMKNAYR